MSPDARGPGARPSEALEFTPSEAALRRALARARDGKPLDQGEAATLLHARGDDLDRLLSYASRTRDAGLTAAGRPSVITYSRKVFIPLTRLCRDRCGYCTFATVPGSAARRPCSPSATARRTGGPRRATGSTTTVTTTRSPTSGPWPSGYSRRPVCSRTSTPAC